MILKKILYKKLMKLKQYFTEISKNKKILMKHLFFFNSKKKEVFDFFDNVKVNDDSEIVKK